VEMVASSSPGTLCHQDEDMSHTAAQLSHVTKSVTRGLGQEPSSPVFHMSGLATGPNMQNAEMTNGEEQRREIQLCGICVLQEDE
jgi:hypothetical protein